MKFAITRVAVSWAFNLEIVHEGGVQRAKLTKVVCKKIMLEALSSHYCRRLLSFILQGLAGGIACEHIRSDCAMAQPSAWAEVWVKRRKFGEL